MFDSWPNQMKQVEVFKDVLFLLILRSLAGQH